MANIGDKRCGLKGCIERPYGEAGAKAELCAEHAKDGMVDVCSKKCGHNSVSSTPFSA